MRSLFAVLAALLLSAGCGSDESTATPDTIATETTATVVSTTEFPAATGTIVELPSESPVPAPATQTAPTATTTPAVTPPAKTPAQPAPKASAPPRSDPAPQTAAPAAKKPAPQPAAPAAKEPAPQPAASAVKEPAPQPQPEPEVKAPAPAPAPAAKTAPSRLPKTHTVDKGGVMHAPGFATPVQRCGACHGKDLKGGKVAPSCFSCHDQVW